MSIDPNHTLGTPEHTNYLIADAQRQFDFFEKSLRPEGGFYTLDFDGVPIAGEAQELHGTSRMVHSFALGKLAGRAGCDTMIDHGMQALQGLHHDSDYGGYIWALKNNEIADTRKLAYGQVFVLLAAASALAVDHPDAQRLLDDVDDVLDTHYWQEDDGLFRDELNRDWTPFSTYRGMNANMHGVEALLTAYEVTGREKYIKRAGRILDFFLGKIAPSEDWRLPEHYHEDWTPNRDYNENPMFRPAGTTPGHSFEMGRLLLQYADLTNTLTPDTIDTARRVIQRALTDAWDTQNGGYYYTLQFGGQPAIRDRYWWPTTEAIGALATLLKLDPNEAEAKTYRDVWAFAEKHYVDAERGGWYPEIGADGTPISQQFIGKPDIYHSIQCALFQLHSDVSRHHFALKGKMPA